MGEAASFQRTLELMAGGRRVLRIQLYKPEGGSLGFSVVGLRSEHQGELGIYVQEIQPEGIAGDRLIDLPFFFNIFKQKNFFFTSCILKITKISFTFLNTFFIKQ